MSVTIVPNWSDISGVVRSGQPATDMKGFVAVTVMVERCRLAVSADAIDQKLLLASAPVQPLIAAL